MSCIPYKFTPKLAINNPEPNTLYTLRKKVQNITVVVSFQKVCSKVCTSKVLRVNKVQRCTIYFPESVVEHCLAITHVSCTPCKAHQGGFLSAWSCIPVTQRQWGFLVPFKGCKSQLVRDNETRVTTPAVEKHNPSVPCRITPWSEGDSYLRSIWDLDPKLLLRWNRWATHLQPGPVARMIYIGSKNRRNAKTMGSAHIVVPLFQTDLCSGGKPIQPCQILQRLVSSAATNVFIFWAQLQSRIPPIPLVFRLTT